MPLCLYSYYYNTNKTPKIGKILKNVKCWQGCQSFWVYTNQFCLIIHLVICNRGKKNNFSTHKHNRKTFQAILSIPHGNLFKKLNILLIYPLHFRLFTNAGITIINTSIFYTTSWWLYVVWFFIYGALTISFNWRYQTYMETCCCSSESCRF